MGKNHVYVSEGRLIPEGKPHLLEIANEIKNDLEGCFDQLGIEAPPMPEIGEPDTVSVPKLAAIAKALFDAIDDQINNDK